MDLQQKSSATPLTENFAAVRLFLGKVARSKEKKLKGLLMIFSGELLNRMILDFDDSAISEVQFLPSEQNPS